MGRRPVCGAAYCVSRRHEGASKHFYCRSPMLCSCSAHEHGSALARPVTVRSAGAVPSTIAAMIRGERKASGASRRMCRSPCPSRRAISAKEAIRPSLMSSIQSRALAIAVSRASRLDLHRRFCGRRMNDALHGGEAWSHPCQRDRGRRLTGSRFVAAGFICWCRIKGQRRGLLITDCEIAPELAGHGLPLIKCEAYNRVYEQPYESH